jgi:hypothetical protein
LEQLGSDLLQIQGRDEVECRFLLRVFRRKGVKRKKLIINRKKKEENWDLSGKKESEEESSGAVGWCGDA